MDDTGFAGFAPVHTRTCTVTVEPGAPPHSDRGNKHRAEMDKVSVQVKTDTLAHFFAST